MILLALFLETVLTAATRQRSLQCYSFRNIQNQNQPGLEIANYDSVYFFDQLESKYGERFTFEALTDTELLNMERLTHEALERDTRITEDDKKSLRPLLMLIEKQRRYRQLYETGLRKVALT